MSLKLTVVVASGLAVASAPVVASGLAPRWGAKRPRNLTTQFIWENAVAGLGLLRSPTRGKPARHNKPVCHNKPTFHIKPYGYKRPAHHKTPDQSCSPFAAASNPRNLR